MKDEDEDERSGGEGEKRNKEAREEGERIRNPDRIGWREKGATASHEDESGKPEARTHHGNRKDGNAPNPRDERKRQP